MHVFIFEPLYVYTKIRNPLYSEHYLQFQLHRELYKLPLK